MNIAAYIRVSTDEQTAENQLPAIKSYCQAHLWPEPVIYAENESAWHQGHQAELARLLRELRTGRRRFDYLVVFALDRLTRGGVLQILTLFRSFEEMNCKIVSLNEPWIAAGGELRDVLLSMVGWTGQYESNRKSVNTRAGIQAKRATGWKPGRPVGSRDKVKRLKKRPVVYRHESPRTKQVGE